MDVEHWRAASEVIGDVRLEQTLRLVAVKVVEADVPGRTARGSFIEDADWICGCPGHRRS